MNTVPHDSTSNKVYQVVILVYPGLTLLDAIGPNEALSNSDRFHVTFVSKNGSDVTNDQDNLSLSNLQSIRDIHQADILLIPGGPGDRSAMDDDEVLNWIVEMDKTTL